MNGIAATGDMQRMKLALLALAACGHASPPVAPAQQREVASVPFEADFNLIFVQVAVGNAPPRTFLLDSGADQTIVDAAAARELGLALDNDGKTVEPGGEIQLAHARDVTFHVGGAPFTVRDVWVTPLGELHRFVGRRFDGLLGHAFLERYATRISYASRRITLYEPGTFDYRGTGASIPVEIKDAEAFVHATLDTGSQKVDARLKLDTGSLDALGLSGSFVVQQHLFAADRPRVPQPGVALGGNTQGFYTRIAALVLGPNTLGPLVIGYNADASKPSDRAGTVGAEALRRFEVTFDYKRHRIILEPNAAIAEPFATDHCGLFGSTSARDFAHFTILAVAADSPAAKAGLAAGDEIVAIDGTPFPTYGLPRLWARLHAAGTVRFTLSRDGAQRTVDVALRPLL